MTNVLRNVLRAVALLCLAVMAVLAGCGGDDGDMTIIQNTPDSSTQLLTNANLSYLEISNGKLNPAFSSGSTAYTALFIGDASITITPVAAAYGAAVLVNGKVVPPATKSPDISLNPGRNTILVTVMAPDGTTTKTYTITAVRLSQEAYAKASNSGTSDYFGYRVSLSGDTLAVGAYEEASNATGVNGPDNDGALASGAVYVFTRTNGIWTQQAYLKASNTGAYDQFGRSVSVSGDTLAVGAAGEDSNATSVTAGPGSAGTDDGSHDDSGAVYVFTRTNGAWSQQAYIKASNTGVNDFFGHSVSLSGDTLAVGARFESSNATGVTNGPGSAGTDDGSHDYSGAVYVFKRTNGAWSQQAYIKASNTGVTDFFGHSVSLSGDTLAVGAYGEDSSTMGVNGDQANNSAVTSGAVYVFTRTNGIWSQQAYIKASNTGVMDQFGYSVSLWGDTLAVGAYGEDSIATGVTNGTGAAGTDGAIDDDRGAVYVFTRTSSTWTQQAYIKASNTGWGDQFGISVSLWGDTLAVGAYTEDSNATGVNGDQGNDNAPGSGAVYLFTRTSGVWSQQAYIKASNTELGDLFGISVSLSGDTLAAGAYGEDSIATGVNGNQSDNNASYSGAVYVFQ